MGGNAMDHFKPLGDKARWRYLYDLLQLTDDGDILTYEQMAEVLGLDPVQDRGTIRVALQRAAKEHEEVDKRAVQVVPNKGYRIVAPKEHLALAKQHHTRSTRALVRGRSKVTNVDMSKVHDPEVVKAFRAMSEVLAYQIDFGRRSDRKLREHEKVLEALVEDKNRSQADRDELAERMARIEERLGLNK